MRPAVFERTSVEAGRSPQTDQIDLEGVTCDAIDPAVLIGYAT